MASPLIWGGNGAQLLQAGGINRVNGQVLQFNGAKNYLANPLAETGTTTGWSLGNVSLTSAFPSGTPTFGSGASGNLTLSVTSSSPLSGTYSFSYASSAATTAGNFIASDAFTVDTADLGHPLTVQFSYQATSNGSNGNFSGTSSNSFGIALYDVTAGGSNWIMPAGVWGMTQNAGAGVCTATFQPSVTVGQQYRLVVFNANASAGAITLYFDQLFVGPQTAPIGPVVTDWASYIPNFSAGFGTVTGNTAFYRRDGDSLEVMGSVTTGTRAATIMSISLPSGLSINTSKITTSNTTSADGQELGQFEQTGASSHFAIVSATGTSTTLVYVGAVYSSAAYLTPALGSTGGLTNTSFSSYYFKVPIAGWSSNVQMSNDTDTRIVAATLGGTPANVTTGNPIIYPTVNTDTHGAYNATTGIYTVPVTGYYRATMFNDSTAVSGTVIYLSVNGNTTAGPARPVLGSEPGTNLGFSGSAVVYANAGQTLALRPSGNLASFGSDTTASFERLSGPSVIAASDTVAASYFVSSNFAAGTTTPINFDTKEFDTTNSVTTSASAWKFTAPVSGTYAVSMIGATNTGCGVILYKNTVAYKFMGNGNGANSGGYYMQLIRLNAGDAIDLRPTITATFTGGSLASTNVSNVSIIKVGN